MLHAYLILAHKNQTQLIRMISALPKKNSHFFVHVDYKANINNFIDIRHNAQICEKRVNIHWGGFSMIEATACLINMLRFSGFKPDYVHLLSGQDFPLNSSQTIDMFFENNYGKNFMDYHTIPFDGWADNGGLDRICYKWNIDGGKRNKYLLETCMFPADMQPYGGSQWWSLTGECVEWLTDKCRPGELLYDFYRNTRIPDEMFFQTAVMNSSFAETVINDNLRYINWTDGP